MIAVPVVTAFGIRRRRGNLVIFGVVPDQWLRTCQDVDGNRVEHDRLKHCKSTLIEISNNKSGALNLPTINVFSSLY